MRIIHAMSLAAALALPLVPAWAYADAQQNDDDYIRAPLRLDKRYDKAFEGGCKYTLTVSGTVTPLPGQENEKAPQVSPNVAVSAFASCPNEASVKVTENILGTGPLTWRQLADSLAQRARVVTTEKQHECVYAPKIHVVGTRVDVVDFDYHCRTI